MSAPSNRGRSMTTTTESPPDPREIDRLVEQIMPILAGHHEAIQSGVLADLLSMWLAGHFIEGSAKKTAKLREELLRDDIKLGRRLSLATEAMVLGGSDRG